MKLHRLFNVLVVQMLFSFPLSAQQSDLTLMLFGCSTFPVGEFSDKIGDDPRITRRFGFDYGKEVGLAVTGFAAGIEINQQVLTENLNWIISTKCMLNTVDNSEIESFFRNEMADSVNISFDNGQWLNIPIFTGFSYYYSLVKEIRVYGMLQGGLNITRQPYRKAIVNGEVVEETTFRFVPDFGIEVGFGFEVFRKVNIGFRYLNLSKPRYEGSRILNESFFTTIPKREMNVDGDKRPISVIMVILGYNL